MSDRLTPEREAEIRRALTSKTKWRGGTWWAADATDLLAELDGCRRGLAEERARTTRLTDAMRHVIDDSPGTPDAVKRYLSRRLAECGAGTEQPA